MARPVRFTPYGFKKFLAASVLLHIIIITAFLVVKTEPRRTFITPYTVNILDSVPRKARLQAREAPLPEEKAQGPEQSRRDEPKEAAPEPKRPTVSAKKETHAPPARKEVSVSSTTQKEDVSVDDAIKSIGEKVRKKEERDLVSSRIEEMERRQRRSGEVEAGVEEIRKRLSEARLQPVQDDGHAYAQGVDVQDMNVRYGDYIRAVGEKVQANWAYPVELVTGETSVIVSVRIGRKGELLGITLEKSSGSSRFDSSLMSAVKKTAPFPPLPGGFEENHLEIGLRFCPSCE